MSKITYIPNRVIDADGISDGASIYVYQSGGTTPVSLFSDAGLSTPIANPVVVASGAPVPPLYYSYSGDIRVKVVQSDGSTTSDEDPYLRVLTIDDLDDIVESLGSDLGVAVGDGTTDDTAALQAALNSSSKLLRLTNGKTYRTTSVLTVPAGKYIEATGATIFADHNGKAFTFTNGGGMNGGKITGPGGAAYLSGSIGIFCSGTNNNPSAPTYATCPELVRVEVEEFGEYGMYFQYVKKGKIDSPFVHDCGYAGIAGASCEDILVETPRVYDIGPGSPADAYGIFFDRKGEGAGGTETADPRSYRITILTPDIQRVIATGGNGEGIDSHGGVDIKIEGGSIIGCQVGIAFVRSNVNGVEALGPIRCKALGTVISGGHEGYGVKLTGAVVGGAAVATGYAEDCEIDVTIEGHGLDSVGVPNGDVGGILIQATRGTKINGTLKDNESCGIYINFDNYYYNIAATIVDPHSDTFTAPSCIRIAGNRNTGYIGGCTFAFRNAALGTYVATNSVRIEAALTGLDIDFGLCSFQGVDATHLTFTPGTTTGVRYRGICRMYGTATINAASGNPYDAVDVVYPKRFPYTPEIVLIPPDFVTAGTTRALFYVDRTGTPPTATGVRIFARPASGASWPGATENIQFGYIAE